MACLSMNNALYKAEDVTILQDVRICMEVPLTPDVLKNKCRPRSLHKIKVLSLLSDLRAHALGVGQHLIKESQLNAVVGQRLETFWIVRDQFDSYPLSFSHRSHRRSHAFGVGQEVNQGIQSGRSRWCSGSEQSEHARKRSGKAVQRGTYGWTERGTCPDCFSFWYFLISWFPVT